MSQRTRTILKEYVRAFVAIDSLKKRGFPVPGDLASVASAGIAIHGMPKIEAAARSLIATLDVARNKWMRPKVGKGRKR